MLLGALLPGSPPRLEASTQPSKATVRGYISELPGETPEQRAERHRRVAERRGGPIVIVHRGASAFAPENTLEAYAAAVDYGADGCEVDIRRTSDGVLTLFHDDMLDHLTDGFGTVDQLRYSDLLALHPRQSYGTANADTRPPTFAALLGLARQRAMLLHLDVKQKELDEALAEAIQAADMWDHIVAVNDQTAPRLRRDARLSLLAYRGPGLYDRRQDLDPDSVRAQFAMPGQMIMVDDPRVAASQLGRAPHRPVPQPAGLRKDWPAGPSTPAAGDSLVPMDYLRSLASGPDVNSTGALLKFVRGHVDERGKPEGDAAYERARTERIVARAWAAQRLGALGRPSPEIVTALEGLLKSRSLHRDWMYHGLDGACAARSLGQLKSVSSAPVLVAAFRRVDPALSLVANPAYASNPLSWTDFRAKMTIIPALGELRCPASKRFLLDYVALDEKAAREVAPLLYEDATRSLMEQQLSPAELDKLLSSPNLAVRGTAILTCLDRPTGLRTAALGRTAPWAVALPGVKR